MFARFVEALKHEFEERLTSARRAQGRSSVGKNRNLGINPGRECESGLKNSSNAEEMVLILCCGPPKSEGGRSRSQGQLGRGLKAYRPQPSPPATTPTRDLRVQHLQHQSVIRRAGAGPGPSSRRGLEAGACLQAADGTFEAFAPEVQDSGVLSVNEQRSISYYRCCFSVTEQKKRIKNLPAPPANELCRLELFTSETFLSGTARLRLFPCFPCWCSQLQSASQTGS